METGKTKRGRDGGPKKLTEKVRSEVILTSRSSVARLLSLPLVGGVVRKCTQPEPGDISVVFMGRSIEQERECLPEVLPSKDEQASHVFDGDVEPFDFEDSSGAYRCSVCYTTRFK